MRAVGFVDPGDRAVGLGRVSAEWSGPWTPDTFVLCREGGWLTISHACLHGCEVVDGRVQPSAVVVAGDPPEHLASGQRPARPLPDADLTFEDREEAFGCGVIAVRRLLRSVILEMVWCG